MPLKKIIFIVGPTAVGKSRTAFLLAQKVNGEIISCDSMQIYKEVNIVNDKPSQDVLAKVRHHLVDIISVEEEFDVARFNQLTIQAINDVHSGARIPIIVGGSGMYVNVLLDGIFPSGEKNEELRASLLSDAERYGNEHLYNMLKERDAAAAAKIHSNDLKRLVRALEVCLTENKPISELQKERKGLWGKYDISILGLNMDREKLYDRINERVDEMFERGLVAEIKSLSAKNLSYSANRMIGIREVQSFINNECSLDEAKDIMKMNTRRFAKRQLTWFRKEKRIQWFMIKEGDNLDNITGNVVKLL